MRLNFIDVGRGIGILILITITHNFYLPASILNFDGYILMPFFFFLSGFVFSVKESDSFYFFLKKKLELMYCPIYSSCLLVFVLL